MGDLDGRVAVVTGAGHGIGEATARLLAADGARVVVCDLDGAAAESVADAVGGLAHVADLTAPGACDELIEATAGAFGGVDVVVNNAGFVRDAPLHKVTDELFQQMLDIHAVVPFRVLRAAAPHLRQAAKADAAEGRETFRKVVNVISLAGVMGNAGQAAYAAGKGAAVGLTKSLAKEWGPLKINVNAVAFGLIETRMTAELPEAARSALAGSIPLGRGATPVEAANAIHFLCSPASDYVHGQVLPVSGGLAVGMTG